MEGVILALLLILPRTVVSNEIMDILPLMKEFNMKHPIIVQNDNKNHLKELFFLGHFLTILKNELNISQPKADVISFTDNQHILKEIDGKSIDFGTVIIVTKDPKRLTLLKPKANQKIFILTDGTKKLYEFYYVQSIKIVRELGKIADNQFLWKKGIDQAFVRRRSNFHGIALKAMTEQFGNLILLNETYRELAPYFPKNDTFLVNNYISGLCQDILMELQNVLNFTTLLYKRSNVSWGVSGIMGDVYFNRADFVAMSMTQTYERSKYVDFMLPITPRIVGIFIPNMYSSEKFDWTLLASPFAIDLWIVVVVTTLVITLSRFKLTIKSLSRFFEMFATSFGAFFGGSSCDDNQTVYKRTTKILKFSLLFSGMIIWAAYQSFLTAELLVHLKRLPFNDLDSFSQSDWR